MRRQAVLGAGVGSVLVGGVFFALSAFVLPAFTRLPDDDGAAIRWINVLAVRRPPSALRPPPSALRPPPSALRPPLMVALFGTAVACTITGVLAVRRGEGWVVAGSGTYLVGVVLVTVAANVLLNDRLAD